MIKNIPKHFFIFISAMLLLLACQKNSDAHINDSIYVNNKPFWLFPFPEKSPYDIVNYTKNKSYLNCPVDTTIGYSNDNSLFVILNKYVWLDEEFKVNFYFWDEKLSNVLLSLNNKINYEDALKRAEKFTTLFITIKGKKPKIENRIDSDTKEKIYKWEDESHVIKIIISKIISDNAIFNISFSDKAFLSTENKYQSKYDYLKKCRTQSTKNKTVNDNIKNDIQVPSPPKPPVRH